MNKDTIVTLVCLFLHQENKVLNNKLKNNFEEFDPSFSWIFSQVTIFQIDQNWALLKDYIFTYDKEISDEQNLAYFSAQGRYAANFSKLDTFSYCLLSVGY